MGASCGWLSYKPEHIMSINFILKTWNETKSVLRSVVVVAMIGR